VSPIPTKLGSANQFTCGLSIAYSFNWSGFDAALISRKSIAFAKLALCGARGALLPAAKMFEIACIHLLDRHHDEHIDRIEFAVDHRAVPKNRADRK